MAALLVFCPATPASATPASAASASTDPELPVVTVGDAIAIEGNTWDHQKVVTFVAELDRALPYDEAAIVEYETESGQATFGAATQGSDFEAARGTIAFFDGATRTTFTVSIAEDTIPEFDETFRLQLEYPYDNTPTNVVLAATEVTGTISNDDGIALTIPDTSAAEGSSGGTKTMNVTVSLSAPAPSDVTFDWRATSGGSVPASGSDFAGSGQGRITKGAWSTTLPVTLKGDTTVESNETFLITLTNVSGGSLTSVDSQGTETITNDDGATVSASSVTVQEGNEGTTLATTKVSLSSAAASEVIVNYETLAVTAQSDDFEPTKSSQVTIPAGSTYAYVSVAVYGDTAIESSQYFTLRFTAATGATVYTPTVQVNIIDDDGVRIGDAEPVGEPDDEGYQSVYFPVTVSPKPTADLLVAYETEQGTAGTSDYYSSSGKTGCSTNGMCSGIYAAVKADDAIEDDETFLMEIYPDNSTPYGIIQTDEAKGTILANDGIRVSDLSVIEGASGSTTEAVFTVTMDPAPAYDTYINFYTSDSTARAGSDYTAVSSGAVKIPAGSTSGTGVVKITGDNSKEGDERFYVKLNAASSGTIVDSSGTIQILNDDGLIVSDAAVWENDAKATFTVSVWPAPSTSVSFNYKTANQSATGGTSGARDYTTTSGSKSIPAGSTYVTIDVPLVDDDWDEADVETFLLEITNVAGVTPADTQAIATIKDYET